MSDPAQTVPQSLLPQGIRDPRQEALTRIMGRALGELDVASLVMTDPMTVDTKLLPYLIREFSAQNLIQSDFPEHVQRRLLKNIWEIKSLTGYDAGVKLGLGLLGMTAQIEHWHQVEPKRAPNTHLITLMMNEVLFDDPEGYFSQQQIRAATRMIDATKRQSQGTDIRLGVENHSKVYVGCFGAAQIKAVAGISHEQIPALTASNSQTAIPTSIIRAQT